MPPDVATNLQAVRRAIAEAALRSGRSPREVSLVAVTKTVRPEAIRAAYAAGQTVFGENRVQEGAAKIARLGDDMAGASWHLIGHLQSNKAKRAVEVFSLIESVDSAALAARLDALAGRSGRRLPILLEVNVSGEATKSGLAVAEFWRAMEAILGLPHLEPRGLMTVAPLVSDANEVRNVFRRLRELRDEAQHRYSLSGFRDLSMGMSGDFEVAIEEGSTMVRIGRALFGERPAAPGSV